MKRILYSLPGGNSLSNGETILTALPLARHSQLVSSAVSRVFARSSSKYPLGLSSSACLTLSLLRALFLRSQRD